MNSQARKRRRKHDEEQRLIENPPLAAPEAVSAVRLSQEHAKALRESLGG